MVLCPYCAATVPEPTPPTCPSCGAVLSGDVEETAPSMAAASGPGASPGPPPLPPFAGAASPSGDPDRRGTPWDERGRLGFAAAFVETTRQLLTGPTDFFRRMPLAGGLGGPLLYAVIAGWLGLVAAALYQSIWVSIMGPSVLPFGMEHEELARVLAFMESWAGLVAQIVFGGISITIGAFITAGILHVMLLVLGGGQKTFEATFRAVCFSQAPMILFVIPVFLIPGCGLVLALWSLVLYVIGLAQAHQIGYGRAVAAVLLPLVALCCCCAGFAFTLAGAIAGLAGHVR
jgi:hypothetical protein